MLFTVCVCGDSACIFFSAESADEELRFLFLLVRGGAPVALVFLEEEEEDSFLLCSSR